MTVPIDLSKAEPGGKVTFKLDGSSAACLRSGTIICFVPKEAIAYEPPVFDWETITPGCGFTDDKDNAWQYIGPFLNDPKNCIVACLANDPSVIACVYRESLTRAPEHNWKGGE